MENRCALGIIKEAYKKVSMTFVKCFFGLGTSKREDTIMSIYFSTEMPL